MKPLINPFVDAIKHLAVIRDLPNFFDPEERQLVVQSIIIGVVVWGAVFVSKGLVHLLFETTLHQVEHGPSIFLIFVPLLVGALIVAALARYGASTVHYRDGAGHLYELIDVEGDGLERAISLYYASEPTMEQALLGQKGVDVRWQLPTLSLVTLVVTSILAHDNTIYRTQREQNEQRGILPSYSVRRVAIPIAWVGQTIVDLQIRSQYNLNVIGLIEKHRHDDHIHEHTRLNPDLSRPLKAGEPLIVLGENDKLNEFEMMMREIDG